MIDYLGKQKDICKKYNTQLCPAEHSLKLGVSANLETGNYPIHGLRHLQTADTCGWYIWAGEYSESDNFFSPRHVGHLNELCPEIIKYLGLPPGFRFLLALNYEDVWFDEALLKN